MHFHRLRRAQKGLLNTFAKFNNLGFSYGVLGGTTIQQHTCSHSTKRDMQLQQLMSRRQQKIWSKNVG